MQLLFRKFDTTAPTLALSDDGKWTLGKVELRFPEGDGLFYLYEHATFPLSESIGLVNLHTTRDAWSALVLNGVKIDSYPIAVFYRADTKTVLFITNPCNYAGRGFATVPQEMQNMSALRIVQHLIPEAGISISAMRAKQWLSKRIATQDSLSELSKQVDLLSCLVFALADRLELDALPDWYAALRDAVLTHPAYAAKSALPAIRDIATHKKRLALLIDEYQQRKSLGDDCCAVCTTGGSNGTV